MWTERWFLSCNAKDIGTLYLIFALFSGLLGTAFSVLIRLELAGPGVQYIADHQLYNSIITAHAILMIFFMVNKLQMLNSFLVSSVRVKNYHTDGRDPYSHLNIINSEDNYLNAKSDLIGLSDSPPKGDSIPKINPDELTKLNPNWVTGLTDAEGCFHISVVTGGTKKWHVRPVFKIGLNSRDLPLLQNIQQFFGGVGYITKSGTMVNYQVWKLEDLVNVIVPHFQAYPLQSEKNIDFSLWEQCLGLIKDKKHLTEYGIMRIIRLKCALNLGLPEKLKAHFPGVESTRPNLELNNKPLDPNWVTGFTDGDGCFYVSIVVSTNQVRGVYHVKLHVRETPLIYKLQKFYGGAGRVYFSSNDYVQFTMSKIKDLNNLVLPQFNSHKLESWKIKDYLVWREIEVFINCSKGTFNTRGFKWD